MRDRQRALLTQVPDLPDRYDPTSARPPSRRSATPDPDAPPNKLQRVRLPSNSDDEDLVLEHRRHPHTTPLRIDSDAELEELRPSPLPPDSGTQIALNLLFGEHAPQVEKSGPSHGEDASAARTPRESQPLFSSDEDDEESMEWAAPRAGLVRRGRGGRPARHPPRRRRRAANPFVEFEAEEGDDEESGSESDSAQHTSLTHAAQQTSSPTHPPSHSSDSEDSASSTELNDSFVVPDDCFE